MIVVPPDLELWLTAYLRSKFPNVDVTNKEPPTLKLPLSKPLIVVRDDGGPKLGYTTFNRSVGVSVLAGTRTNDKPANDLARGVAGALFDTTLGERAGPIVSVEDDGCNGPYAVQESLDVARRYITAEYIVIGEHN